MWGFPYILENLENNKFIWQNKETSWKNIVYETIHLEPKKNKHNKYYASRIKLQQTLPIFAGFYTSVHRRVQPRTE